MQPLRAYAFLPAVVALFATPRAVAADAPPNVLIFIADDMAVEDCGAYGHPHIRTPNIDRLAHEGVRFDAAFLTCSSCSPSRSSILTSRYPHNTGAHQLHLPLPAEQVLVSAPLRDAGYHTAAVGKWHLGNAVKNQFDEVKEGEVDQMVPTLRDRPTDKPFFFWFAFIDPHRPYQMGTIDTPHLPEDAVVPPFLPDTPAVRDDLAMYYDEISRMDANIGDVLAELDRQGISENTVVVFLSDNGRPVPRCKTTVYDSGIQTPLIVRWPGEVKPGTTQALVSSIDVMATVCDMAGVPRPKSFQGGSFLPMLDDLSAHGRDAVFAEHNWHDYEARDRAVRTPTMKYIRYDYNDLPGTPPADAVRSPTFDEMKRLRDANMLTDVQTRPFVVPQPKEELFDLTEDPHELVNLAEDPAYADELHLLRLRLDHWQRETDDAPAAARRPDGFDRESGEPLRQRR
ncbi:MAG: sulfatase [Planctomycetota bacterium]|nr:sulfatase [Planctomycetota bacterium]